MKYSVKRYIPFVETVNSVCWFLFDFFWMMEWDTVAKIGAVVAVITGIMVLCLSVSWANGALTSWIIMNSLWMIECDSIAIWFGVAGLLMIVASLMTGTHIGDLLRLRIKQKQQ